MASRLSSSAPASASASRSTGTTSSRWRREATSGTTPPKRACSSAWEETTFARIWPSCVTTAAAVSSQEVSSARIIVRTSHIEGLTPDVAVRDVSRTRTRRQSSPRAFRATSGVRPRTWPKKPRSRVVRLADRVLPHDQRVLTVVGVVAAPDAAGLEAQPLVQGDGTDIRDPHLEGVAASTPAGGYLEEPLHHRRRDPATS